MGDRGCNVHHLNLAWNKLNNEVLDMMLAQKWRVCRSSYYNTSLITFKLIPHHHGGTRGKKESWSIFSGNLESSTHLQILSNPSSRCWSVSQVKCTLTCRMVLKENIGDCLKVSDSCIDCIETWATHLHFLPLFGFTSECLCKYFIAIHPGSVEIFQSGPSRATHMAKKIKLTQSDVLLYHLFINVIYFSISSFFLNSNIHKILTVCKKNMSYGTSENSYKK